MLRLTGTEWWLHIYRWQSGVGKNEDSGAKVSVFQS